jgi:type I restriction enzyme S subunit
MNNCFLKKVKLGDYIELLTDYHSGGSYQTLRENTKILHEPSYARMIRTLNFEQDDFDNNYVYVDKQSYDFLEYCHVKENDVFVNKIANPGSVYILSKVDYPTVCGLNLFQFRFKNINQRYMYYVMKNSENYIKSQAHGTTTKTITKDEMRNLELPIHSNVSDQNYVERILTNIDKKIQNNKDICKLLENNMELTYYSWFVNYNRNKNDDLIYNEKLKNNIPSSWEAKKISECFDMVNGFPFSSDYYCNMGKYKLYTIKNVQDSGIVSRVDNYIDKLPDKISEDCILKQGDIIMSLTGNVGRVGVVYEKNALLNQRVLKIKEKNDNSVYAYMTFKNSNMRTMMENMATGTSQKNLSPIKLGDKIIICPPDKMVKEYNDKFLKSYNLINILKEELNNLEELKNFLLPLLFSEKVRLNG